MIIWTKVSLSEVLGHVQGLRPASEGAVPMDIRMLAFRDEGAPEGDSIAVWLSDGSCVACTSQAVTDKSGVTTVLLPQHWIGHPDNHG